MGEEKKTRLGPLATGPTHPGEDKSPVASALGTNPAASGAVGTPPPSNEASAAKAKPTTSYVKDAKDPLIGATVAGRYQILKKLGEGGMGGVYLAVHNVLEKQVALKILHVELARKEDLVDRFMQEAKAASRIRHENVIDISDFGATDDGLVFFAMELLTGHDLHDEITRAKIGGNLLPWSRSKKIFLQICSALSAAHAKGIIHRDLKPENVYLVDFLGDPDFVKLLDFGIAKMTDVSGATPDEGARKLTKTGMLFGTPEYMSPEQARGDKIDHRVDIYAMGCILFQMITNQVPFTAESFMGVLSQHLTEEPPQIAPETFDRIGAPRELGDVIDRALAKDRNVRYQTIDDFANAVREVSGDPLPADKSTRMKAASVPSPGETTRMKSPSGPSAEALASGNSMFRSKSPTARTKTAWTGNLSVPEESVPDEAPKKSGSKLPLILGGGVLLVGGFVAAIVIAKGSSSAPKAPPPAATKEPKPPVVEPPPPPPPPQEAPLPAMATIVFDSTPKGAQVVDANDGTSFGKTPTSFTLPGSKTARRFKFVLKGYGDSVVELVPNRERIEFNQPLVKGATASTVVVKVPDPSIKPASTGQTTAQTGSAGSAQAKPDTGSASTTTQPKPDSGSGSTAQSKPDTKPDTHTNPLKPLGSGDDCKDDEPCLKVDVPGLSGSGSGSK